MPNQFTKYEGQLVPCATCQKEIPKVKHNTKYCSTECRNTWERHKRRKTKPCAFCGKDFMPISTINKFCTVECREESIIAKKHKPVKDKPCVECGSTFTPVVACHKFCSAPCKHIANRKYKSQFRSSPEQREKTKAYNKEYSKVRFADYSTLKDRNLRITYGISLEIYMKMLEDQNYVCAICELPPPGKKPLSVDHCHKTGRVRKLLCTKCNNLLGNCDEDIRILDRTMDYIVEHEKLFETNDYSI